MTSDHQAISTMHTPLPKQQVSAKDVHMVCKELGALSMANGDCGEYSLGDSHSTAREVGSGQLSAASLASEQQLSAMNGTEGDAEVVMSGQATEIGIVNGMPYLNDGCAISRQDSEISVDAFNSGEQADSTGGQRRFQTADQSVLSSPSDGAGADNETVANGIPVTNPDGVDVQSAPWPGYEMTFEDLKTRVRHQLEYYFSRENLAADAYLRSQMDSEQFVKVSIVANFNMVKRLTTDLSVVLQALRESPFLQVDENGEKVRPVHKRCTLILREIPDDTAQQEVEDLFASPTCPNIISCEYALNNIWYVNFESDEDAQKAFLYLRQQVQNFKGKPILARIKTAPIPRVQNGYRPVPPNSLQLQTSLQGAPAVSGNVTTPNSASTLVSPAVDTVALPLAFPPSTVCTPVGAPGVVGPVTPSDSGAGCLVVCSNSVTLPGSTGVTAIPASNLYYYPTGAGQPAIVAAAAGHPSAIVAAPTAAAVLSPTWPSAGPASFDLGYILAVNGYQPQGAYRPALLVPAAPIPAQVAASIGHRFVAEQRQPRKTRSSGSYYPPHSNDRGSITNAENGRPAPVGSHNRYSTPSRTSGNYGESRASYYRNDQNFHYNNIRNRPNRQSMNGPGGNTNGNGSRRFQQQRGERFAGADYWSSSTSLTKDRKAAPSNSTAAAAANGTASASSVDGRRSDGFDLQSSSFPPLPTVNSEQAETDSAPTTHDSSTAAHVAAQAANTQSQALLQCFESNQKEANGTADVPAVGPTSTAKVRPRVVATVANIVNGHDFETQDSPPLRQHSLSPVGSTLDEKVANCSEQTARSGNTLESVKNASAFANESHLRGQKISHKNALSSAAATGGIIRGGPNTIPVAVVVPNAQPKLPRVSTADKATVTDALANVLKKGQVEERSMSVATMTSNSSSPKPDDAVLTEDKASNECAKRMSYADMAKHAAPRGALYATAAATATTEKSAPAPTASVGTSTVSATGSGKEHHEEAGRRWGQSRGGAKGATGTNGQSSHGRCSYQRDSSHKYNSGRKQSRPYRNRDYQQQQDYSQSQYQEASPPPASG